MKILTNWLRLLAFAAILGQAFPAMAQTTLGLNEGGMIVLGADRDIASVVVSNEGVVTVEPRGRRSLVVFGRKAGFVEILLLDADNRLIEQNSLEVRHDLTALNRLITEAAPGSNVVVSRAGDVIVLSGVTVDSAQSALIQNIVQGASPNVRLINMLVTDVDDQVAVSVRVMEVRTNRLSEVGLRWSAQNRFNDGNVVIGSSLADAVAQIVTGGLFGTARFTVDRFTLDSYIDFLRNEGVATLLAQPVILTTDGERARFLAGGELPVPVPYLNTTGGTSTLGYTYKPYGVTLEFTSRILDGDRVRLQLSAEVSSVDRSQAVEFAGARVPALTTRRAETTVVLAFGESVAIAGLRSAETTANRRRLPFDTPFGIGDILAGNRAEQGSETELVLIVTPIRASEVGPVMPSPTVPGTEAPPAVSRP